MSVFGAPYASGSPPRGGRRPSFKWWILVLILVLGFFLMVIQTVPREWGTTALQRPSPTSAALTPEREAAEEGGFLAEYQPDVIPSLDLDRQGEQAPAAPVEEDASWPGLLDVVAKLALVIGLVYLAVAGLRWLQKGRRGQADAGGASIRVLETLGLAPGRSLHLIVAGDKMLLIGATDHHLSLLTELPAASAPLGEDVTAFEEALTHQSNPPGDSAAAAAVEWRVAVERLRGGVQGVRQAFGGGKNEPTA